jgi:hypothetical protein
MATPELFSPHAHQPESETQPTEPIEAIRLPDGSAEPAYLLALKGLEISLRAGEIDDRKVAQMYQGWDPQYPLNNIYKHIHSR